jgi:hypothetical protein
MDGVVFAADLLGIELLLPLPLPLPLPCNSAPKSAKSASMDMDGLAGS